MELLTLLLRLPFLPLKGTIRLAEIIHDEAERELRDPARVRRELEEAQRRREAGEISEEELARFEEQAMSPLLAGQLPARQPSDEERPDNDRS
jgi:hypothetical protein